MESGAPKSSFATQIAGSKSMEAISDLKKKIPEIDNIFNVIERIGNGTFSTVLLATLKKVNDHEKLDKLRSKYAIKHHVPTSHPDRIVKELKCMTEIGGKDNVVGINFTIRHNESVAFVMPYLPHDRFHDFYDKMPLEEIQCFMKNLLIALRRVHKFNVIHRDVKPSNFLYNRHTRQFLLVDFGLAQEVNPKAVNNQPGKFKRRACELEDEDDEIPAQSEVSNAKRVRCSQETDTPSTPFKLPLRQLNTIAKPTKKINAEVQLKSPLSRQVKSVLLGVTLTDRLQQRHRNSISMHKAENVATQLQRNETSRTPQYSTNHKLNAKCYCYGKSQICNICLIKKEVHASRAGTPGYRSPEVLLKYPEQTSAVDIWAVGVIFLSILSSVYPFFKAPDDYVALAEMVTIFGDKAIRKTAFVLGRLVTISHWTKPLDLRKLCVRLRNHKKLSFSLEIGKKHMIVDGDAYEPCKNCQQLFHNCLCRNSTPMSEIPLCNDPFPMSAYDLLNKLLELNPHKRISAEEALKHPFFEAVDVTA